MTACARAGPVLSLKLRYMIHADSGETMNAGWKYRRVGETELQIYVLIMIHLCAYQRARIACQFNSTYCIAYNVIGQRVPIAERNHLVMGSGKERIAVGVVRVDYILKDAAETLLLKEGAMLPLECEHPLIRSRNKGGCERNCNGEKE